MHPRDVNSVKKMTKNHLNRIFWNASAQLATTCVNTTQNSHQHTKYYSHAHQSTIHHVTNRGLHRAMNYNRNIGPHANPCCASIRGTSGFDGSGHGHYYATGPGQQSPTQSNVTPRPYLPTGGSSGGQSPQSQSHYNSNGNSNNKNQYESSTPSGSDGKDDGGWQYGNNRDRDHDRDNGYDKDNAQR